VLVEIFDDGLGSKMGKGRKREVGGQVFG